MQRQWDALPEEEKKRIMDRRFYFECAKAILTFVVFVLLHQLFQYFVMDPWRYRNVNAAKQQNMQNARQKVCPPGAVGCGTFTFFF